jgi:hypothetical protein
MILEGDLQREWRENEARYSRMVFIWPQSEPSRAEAGFESCAAA